MKKNCKKNKNNLFEANNSPSGGALNNGDYDINDNDNNSVSNNSNYNKKIDDDDYIDPPPVRFIRVLRPSNDLTPVQFDSHYNIIQALNGSLNVNDDSNGDNNNNSETTSTDSNNNNNNTDIPS